MYLRRLTALAAALLFAALLHGCGTPANPYYDSNKRHHTPTGFQNNDPSQKLPELTFAEQIYNWATGYFRPRRPPIGGYEAFAAKWLAQPDTAWLRQNKTQTAVTWLGHAGVLLQLDGVNILVDPNFSDRASPISFAGPQRRVPVPIPIADLPPIDFVLVSHNHYDHMDRPSLRALNAANPKTRFIVGLGMKPWFQDEGITTATELDWWESVDAGAVRIHLVPVQHWSKRTVWDRNRALWGGFVVATTSGAPWRFLHTGDTGYSADFAEIRRRLGDIDFAALPVGAYEPRDFMHVQHINPEDAVRIMLDVGAREALGMHWGTFELTQEPFDQPPEDLAAARAKHGIAPERFFLLKHGETRRIERAAR